MYELEKMKQRPKSLGYLSLARSSGVFGGRDQWWHGFLLKSACLAFKAKVQHYKCRHVEIRKPMTNCHAYN